MAKRVLPLLMALLTILSLCVPALAHPAADIPEDTLQPTAEPTAEPVVSEETVPTPDSVTTPEPSLEPEETAAPTLPPIEEQEGMQPSAESEESTAPTEEPSILPTETPEPPMEPTETPEPTEDPEIMMISQKEPVIPRHTPDELRAMSVDQIMAMELYDGRDYGIVTEPRYQTDRSGACGVHGVMGAIETSILRQGLYPDWKTLDLYEAQLSWAMLNYAGDDPLGNATQDVFASSNPNEYENKSLYPRCVAFMLTRWNGPVKETSSSANLKLGFQDCAYKLKNAVFLSGSSNRDSIKRLIAQYGAAVMVYSYSSSSHAYNNGGTDHCSVIIGWDDNVPAADFNNNRVTHDGAWIVKNSFGATSNGGDGCLYLSYDSSFASYFVALEMMDENTYQNNYFYDSLTYTGANIKYGFYPRVAASFQAKQGTEEQTEYVKAVNIGVENNGGTDITVRVFYNVNPNSLTGEKMNPLDGTEAEYAKTTMHVNCPGFYTIPLKEPVPVEKGSWFTVEAEVSGKTVFLTETTPVSNAKTYHSTTMSAPWFGCGRTINTIALKAFTNLGEKVMVPTPTPEPTPTPTPEATPTPTAVPADTPSPTPAEIATPTPEITPTATPSVPVTSEPFITPPPAVTPLPGGVELQTTAQPGAPAVSVPSEEQATLVGVVLTEEEKEAVADGESVKIELTVSDASKDTSEETKAAVAGCIEKAGRGFVVGQYLDISLQKTVGKVSPVSITSTGEAMVTITVTVPETLWMPERTYAVVRVHDGIADILEDQDNVAETITFRTNQFSSYTIIYTNQTDNTPIPTATPAVTATALPVSPSAVPAAPDTGDETPLAIYAGLLVVCLGGLWLILNRSRTRRQKERKV